MNDDSRKPLIGVTPLWDATLKSVWMLPDYLDGIRAAGGIPVVLPLVAGEADIERLAGTFDGFLFTGGNDVSPTVYGEEDRTGLIVPCPERDSLELSLFKAALNAGKPIFGICRGIQFINAALGGTLWQDLPSEHPSDIIHRQEKPYDNPVHQVRLEGSLKGLLGKDSLMVNSHHHQAVRDLAPGLTPTAFAPDGIVEAAEMVSPSRFILAVQWHPEFLFRKDPDNLLIFKHFISRCRRP